MGWLLKKSNQGHFQTVFHLRLGNKAGRTYFQCFRMLSCGKCPPSNALPACGVLLQKPVPTLHLHFMKRSEIGVQLCAGGPVHIFIDVLGPTAAGAGMNFPELKSHTRTHTPALCHCFILFNHYFKFRVLEVVENHVEYYPCVEAPLPNSMPPDMWQKGGWGTQREKHPSG